MADMTYIKLFVDYLDAIEPLGDAERGRLFTSLLEYARTGEAPQLGGNERFLFPMMRAQIDRDNAAMVGLSEARSKAGKIGAEAKQANAKFAKQIKQMPNLPSKSSYDKDEDEDEDEDYISPPPPLPRKAPTFDEVAEYAKLRGGLIDPKPFYDFYSVANWRDTEGKPVYNWQQKFQLWEKRELEKKGGAMNGHGHDTGGDTKKWNVPGAVNL